MSAISIIPEITFITSSVADSGSADLYKWLGPLHDYFKNVSTKFQVDLTGYDAGASGGSGSGGFVISTRDRDWETFKK